MENHKKRSHFSGNFGFVMAAAGSAVGLGNIWRFPYLAAKHGGGTFLFVYIIMALTFGFALLTTEIAIGRKTRQGPLTAYGKLDSKFAFNGLFAWIVPIIIMPYYCAIGGWVLKYLASFVTGQAHAAAQDGFFGAHISSVASPLIWLLIFSLITAFIVFNGVESGIERYSKILMPILIVLIIGTSIFSLTVSHTDDAGVVRTGMQGLKIYLLPNFEGMTVSGFLNLLMDAIGQLFFSISVAMGIMVTYGSYTKKDTSLMKCINQIEFFDTMVAILAGLMIVPAVYCFMGIDGMSAGPGLMFISLPKVFDAMGGIGSVVGIVFFVMVAFAAITSSVSIMEAIVSGLMDKWHMSRKKSAILVTVYTLVMGAIVCLGYNVLYFEHTLPNGSTAQILDIMDYISNSILMPLVSLITCILVGYVIKPKAIIDEVTSDGSKFGRKGLYVIMIKYVAPIIFVILLLQAIGLLQF